MYMSDVEGVSFHIHSTYTMKQHQTIKSAWKKKNEKYNDNHANEWYAELVIYGI